MIDDVAHSGEFLVQLAALHGGVLFAPVMREDGAADSAARGFRRHEHSALHHQLGKADAAEKCGLAALVRAGDDDHVLVVRIEVVADDPLPFGQRKADVIQAGECVPMLRRGDRLRKADRLADLQEPPVQVEAAEIESQFGAQLREEAENVIVDWASALAARLMPRSFNSESALAPFSSREGRW